jgi:hypothetical protein
MAQFRLTLEPFRPVVCWLEGDMYRTKMVWLLSAAMLTPIALESRQDHVSGHETGARVMGFDLSRTTHHFSLYTDGGSIDVGVNDRADVRNRDAIRSHLPHIAVMFGQGRFDAPMLVHDSNNVPGTTLMSRLRDRIRYTYVETPAGGRVNIVTTDSPALEAVHEFLTFQIAEHKTGDSLAARSR